MDTIDAIVNTLNEAAKCVDTEWTRGGHGGRTG